MGDSGRYFVRIDFGNGLKPAVSVLLEDGTGWVYSDFLGGKFKRLHGCSHKCVPANVPETGDKLDMKGFGKLFGLDLKKATYHDATDLYDRAGFFSAPHLRLRPRRPTGKGDWEATDEPGPGPIQPKRKPLGKSLKKKKK